MTHRPARTRRRLCAALALLLGLGGPAVARAHQRGLSRAELRITGERIVAELVFARPEIVELVPGADADRSGQLDELELLSVETLLSEQVLEGIRFSAGDLACTGAVERITFVEEDGLAVAAGFTCPGPIAAFTVRLPLLARLAPGHRLLGHVVFQDMSSETAIPELDFVAHRRRSALTIRKPDPTAPAPPPPVPTVAPDAAPTPARLPWLGLLVVPLGLALVFLLRRRRRA